MAQLLVDVVHRLLAVDREEFGDLLLDALLGLVEGLGVGLHLRGLDLVREVVADGVGQHEVTVGKTLHQGRCAEAVGAVVREVGLADGVETRDGGHQVVVDPDAAHRVVHGGENLHRLLVGADVGDLLVHVEQVAVTLLDDVLAQTLDGGLEVEEHGQTRLVHTVAGVAALLGGARSHVARHEVAEGRVAALQIVVAVLLGDVRRLLGSRTDRLHVLELLGNPDAAVVAQRLRHEREFRLLVAVYGDTRGVDLREAGVGEAGALAVALEGGRAVRRHGVGREEEDVAVAARGDHDGVRAVALDLARHEVAGDDAARLAVLDDDVEHLVARVALHRAGGDLLVQGRVGAEQKLLAGLAAGVEGARYLRAAERTVGQQAAVLAGEGHALCHALIDDEVRDLGQAVDVGLAGAVVAALDRVVEQTVYRVVVVLVVLRGVDTALCGDRVGAAGRILDAEHLDVVAQFAERSGCGGASQTGSDDDDVELALVGGAYDLDSCLVVAPLLGERTGRNFSI